MTETLTKRQKQILDFIVAHNESHGYPPTVREIGKAVGLSSSSTVHAHLRNLEEKGRIERNAVLTRAIKVVEEDESETVEEVVYLPVIGKVAAGNPLLAFEEDGEKMPVSGHIMRGGDGFLLEVSGESMIEKGIMDGDYVIVRQQESADNGDIVVALSEDEATVKQIFRENDRVRLQPANPEMAPIFLDSVKVLGKVVGVFREID